MKQYYKIGEISNIYQIGTDSLRYYEKLGILTPKRGANGYRMYSLHDLWRLNVIRDLRRLDFSMETIGTYLNNRSISTTKQLLNTELSVIDEQMALLAALKKDVAERLSTLESALSEPIGQVTVKSFPARNCHIIQEPYHSDEEMDMLIKRLINIDETSLYILGSNRIGSILPLEAGSKDIYPNYKGVFAIDKNGTSTIEEGTYLSVSFHGISQQHHIYVPKLLEYAREHEYKLTGPMLEILWIDIHTAEDKREHITELQVRCIRS